MRHLLVLPSVTRLRSAADEMGRSASRMAERLSSDALSQKLRPGLRNEFEHAHVRASPPRGGRPALLPPEWGCLEAAADTVSRKQRARAPCSRIAQGAVAERASSLARD